ncbi:molybdopterin synthase catalytic subunit-like [Ylistrum balloti]|uniref:molybdopterin synthase catalytic subunit-like n=1 Tax=Ylistrum balloti TaxID=509963 RepID=UPI002905C2D7|nr:molybdopterin synthase catalytic subunit-like [Ylistrum balloti]
MGNSAELQICYEDKLEILNLIEMMFTKMQCATANLIRKPVVIFSTREERNFLDEDMLKVDDIEASKLLELLGLLITNLQVYQENLKESLEESQIDVETVDGNSVDTGMDISGKDTVSITKTDIGEQMQTELASVCQDASVQTEDILSNLTESLCKNENSENIGIFPGTSSSSFPVCNEAGDVINRGDNCRELEENLVQIRASKCEIDRRIAAFVEKKQLEVNELNRREFCSAQGPEEAENSCARVDSLFFTRADGKSHIKVSRVVNLQGPQTQIPVQTEGTAEPKEVVQKNKLPEGMEERLANMENHLNVNKGKMACSDVYTRLKYLEERILFLESLSPEYFTFQPPHHKRPRKEKQDTIYRAPEEEGMSVSEIDMKIKQLKESLSKKASSKAQTSLSNT